jgi:hypothetical protein
MPTSALSDKLRNRTRALHDEIWRLSSKKPNRSEHSKTCILNYTEVHWGYSSWLDRLHTNKSSMLISRAYIRVGGAIHRRGGRAGGGEAEERRRR